MEIHRLLDISNKFPKVEGPSFTNLNKQQNRQQNKFQMVQASLMILIACIAISSMIASCDFANAASLRQHIQDQMVQEQQTQANSQLLGINGLEWVGTGPFCACNNDSCCSDKGKWRVLVTDYKTYFLEKFPAVNHYDSSLADEFGSGCVTSFKSLCAPKELSTGNKWTDCGGTCDDCTKDGRTCILSLSDYTKIPEANKNDLLTYRKNCGGGQAKTLCGPLEA